MLNFGGVPSLKLICTPKGGPWGGGFRLPTPGFQVLCCFPGMFAVNIGDEILQYLFISRMIQVWHIYLHLVDFYGKCR